MRISSGLDTDPSANCPVRGKHDKPGRQAALLDAATEEFAAHGYDCATTRGVAERAGCSEGLIHRYFGGKRGLLLAVLERRAAVLEATYAAEFPRTEKLEDDIRQLFALNLRTSWESREGMRVSISQAAIDRAVGLQIASLFNDVRVRMIRERLAEHAVAGRIAPGADLDAAAQGISAAGFSMGFFGQVVFEADRGQAARIADQFARTIARGLAATRTSSAEDGPGS
jgi:AcrR family transcriptional regulator